MLVKNLVPWSGHDFSYLPGDNIELPDDVARARKAAGLASDPDPGASSGDNAGALKKLLADKNAELEIAHASLAATRAEQASLAAHNEVLKAQITALGEEPAPAPSAKEESKPEPKKGK